MSIPFMRSIAAYLACAIFIIGITPRVDAAFAPSGIILPVQTDRAADIETLQKALEQKVVKERLANLGLTPDEIQARLGQLSDEQLHNVAKQLDTLKIGGDSGIGIVIGILVIAILVVILIQLTGHRVIIK